MKLLFKETRAFYGLGQGEMAEYLGVTRGHLSMAETGKRVLNGYAMARMANLFSATPAEVKDRLGAAYDPPRYPQGRRFKGLAKLQVKLEEMRAEQDRVQLVFKSLEQLRAKGDPAEVGILDKIEKLTKMTDYLTGETAQANLLNRIEKMAGKGLG